MTDWPTFFVEMISKTLALWIPTCVLISMLLGEQIAHRKFSEERGRALA